MIADIEIIKQSETEAILKTNTVMGNSDDEPEGSKDYWYPINKMGKCGAYQGQFAGKRDATDYIESLANNTNSQHLRTLIPQGYDYYYFTNVEFSVHLIAVYFPNYEHPNMVNPYGDCLLWHSEDAYECLSPQENEWYGKQSIPYLANYYKPINKETAYCDVSYTFAPGDNDKTHSVQYAYGTINFGQGVIPF